MPDPIIITLGVDASDLAAGVSEAVREARAQLELTFTSSVDKAKAKIDEMNQRMKTTSAIIEDNNKRLLELNQTREKASGDEKRRADEEIAALKRVILSREQELLRIDEKRTKLTEQYLLLGAKTDQEKDAIRQTTNARLADIGALKDQSKAQGAVTDEQEKTGMSLKNYFGIFSGIGIVIKGLQTVKDLWALQRREIDLSIQSAERLKDLSAGENDKNKSFFQEFGLRTKAEKDAGQAALNAIGGQSGGDLASVQTAAGNIGANLRDIGISSVNDPRFNGLVSAAGRAQFGGINTANLTTLFSANPNITGPELEAQLGKILAVTGSPARANAFLEAYQNNQLGLNAGGLGGLDNALKLYQGIAVRTSRTQAPEIFTKFAAGLTKFDFGKNMEQRAELAAQLSEAGASELSAIVMQGDKVNTQAVFSGFSKLSPAVQEKAARVLGGGPRAGVALNAAAGIGNQVLPAGTGAFLGPATNAEQSVARQAMANAASATANQPDPSEAEFRKAMELEKTRLQAHPEEMSPAANPNSWIHHTPFLRMFVTDSDVALPRMAAKNAFANKLYALQEAADKIQRGELSAPPGTDAAMYKLIGEMIDEGRDQDGWGPGEYAPSTVSPYFNRANDLLGQVGPATTRPTTRPSTTQPSTQPTSINYHIRQTNYGIGYDQIGAPAQADSRLS